MVFDTASEVGRVAATAAVIYAFMVLALRLSGKRTLAKLNAFDLVVTVALGSVLGTVVISRDVSWAEAGCAVVALIVGQFLLTWLSVRWTTMRSAVRSAPVLLVQDGCLLDEVLVTNRVLPEEVRQAVRAAGIGSLDGVSAVVFETDGSLSVISNDRRGDLSALIDASQVARQR